MPTEIGHVEAIFRYPVKSMGGERLEFAKLGWHGLDGDSAWHSGGWMTGGDSHG